MEGTVTAKLLTKTPTIVRSCMLCGNIVIVEKGTSETDTMNVGLTVCEDCKKAIAWAKKQMKKE